MFTNRVVGSAVPFSKPVELLPPEAGWTSGL